MIDSESTDTLCLPLARATLVVIPTLNEARTITSVLLGLMTGLDESSGAKFVIVDGGSTDGTQQIVRRLANTHPSIFLLHNPKKLQSAAVNLAVQTFGIGMDVVIRCDAHCSYPPDFLRRLLNTLDRTGADAVVVPMDSIGETYLRKAIAWLSDSVIGSGGSAHRAGRKSGFVDHGHHAAFRMDTFCAVGGYDESFSHNEDAEFDCRQRALGARIFLDSTIRIGYHPRGTLRGLWRQYFSYGVGRSRTVRKHPGSLRLRQLAVPLHLSISLLAVALAPWFPWVMAWPTFYFLLLCGAGLAFTVRYRSTCGLGTVPAALVMHTAWACGFFFGLFAVNEHVWKRSEVQPLASQPTSRVTA